MALPLVRLLGVRATLRVLAALGRLSEEAREPLSTAVPARGLSRKAFLRLSAGATVAGGIVFAGTVPAFAEQRRSAATAWVAANETRLPQTLDAFVSFPQVYQQEIYLALSPARRAGLWREHVAAVRAAQPAWNELQRRAYETVERMLANDNLFDFDQFEQHAPTFEKMQSTATDAFGLDRARQLIATLGPENKTKILAEGCSCSRESDLCGVAPWNCGYTAPACQERRGCGAGWVFICNGHCFY
ncbi:bacteriocin fulvocin C-related protein [Kribbella sp. NBC_01505]|uniref:bacteriocin fulvocin C-related protein n=1 Tax=Kribbella sp. NBC_01505 TaxID=2903580 RepID=UPI0038677C02